MRSLTLAAGMATSIGCLLGFDPAAAQPYYGYSPPPNYYSYPPPSYSYYQPPPSHPYYHHHYYHHYYYHHSGYYSYAGCAYQRHRSGNIGAVAGAIGGGIIGAAITHGNPAFTMIGAGAGALTGHAIGRNSHPYPC